MQGQNRRKKLMIIIGVAIIAFLLYQLIIFFSRQGETKVEIIVVPDDSAVSVNNETIKGKTLYLGQGDYTFSATKDGWTTDTQSVQVGKDALQVGLIPEPSSEEVKQYLKDNPNIQLQREAIGGLRANLKGQKIQDQNPLIEFLPYSQESPPFSIDYGLSKERKGDIFLLISDSTPNGREAAMDWIRLQGVDPTDLEIYFSDFPNPLAPKEEEHTH